MKVRENRSRESRGQYIKYYRIPNLLKDRDRLLKKLSECDRLIETSRQDVKQIEKDMKRKLQPIKEFIDRLKVDLPKKKLKSSFPKSLERSRL